MDHQRLAVIRRALPLVIVLATAVVGVQLVVSLLRTSMSTALQGCGDVPALIDLAEPDRVELQRGPAFIPPVLEEFDVPLRIEEVQATLPVVVPSDIPGDAPLQLAARRDVDLNGDGKTEWVIRMFFGSRPPRAGETLAQFLDDGGIMFRQQSTVGVDAGEALRRLHDQGRDPLPPVVSLGPYEAVAIHADPTLRNDLRPWHLYWSDGTSDFNVQGDVDVGELVEMARSPYCGG